MAALVSADLAAISGQRVLVTGASGLLGSALVPALQQRGAAVVTLVRDEVPTPELPWGGDLDAVTVVHGALEDLAIVLRAVNEHEITAVCHLAAQAIVSTAARSPLSTFETNIRGTWHVLEACRQVGTVRAVVVASSDKAYGSADSLPYTEDQPLRGRHPYDVSKSCADLIAASYHATYDVPVSVTRCGNLFGPGDRHPTRIVPGTIASVLRDERPIIRSDGTLVRDYVYVADAAGFYADLLAAMLAGRPGTVGEAFNVSLEEPQSVLEIVHRILRLMDSALEPDVRNEPSARLEIPAQALSAAKARERLGWKPGHTLDEGLSATIDWWRGGGRGGWPGR